MADPSSRKRPSQYKAFDPVAKKLRDAAIKSLAESYLEHARANGGKCKRGFVKGLVDEARSSAQGLSITRDDINNEVKRIQKANSRASVVSPAETSTSAPCNAAPPSNLDILASAVSQISPQPVEISAEVVLDPARNLGKGGRPKGTTNENKRAEALARKKAVNWVTVEYAQKRSQLLESNQTSGKRVTLEDGTLQNLVATAAERFEIQGDFDVPRQTIHSRIKAERLEVWHRGQTSPLIVVEVTLNAYIIGAWMVNCPLSVSQCIELMHNLMSGSSFEQNLNKWKTACEIYSSNPEVPLVGLKYWKCLYIS